MPRMYQSGKNTPGSLKAHFEGPATNCEGQMNNTQADSLGHENPSRRLRAFNT